MIKVITRRIGRIVNYIELLLAGIILVALLLGIIGLVLDMGIFNGEPFQYEHFSEFLANSFSLVIGIEFIKMMIKHTPGSVVEVLLFAIARGLVVEHTATWETLIGIIAIAVVFATRKYLFIHSFEEKEHAIFNADISVRRANMIAMTRIPYHDGDSLDDLIRRELGNRDKEVKEDALVNFKNVSLRIAAMHHDEITKVEVIRLHH